MNKSEKRGELADGYFLLESVKHVYIQVGERIEGLRSWPSCPVRESESGTTWKLGRAKA